MWKHHCATLVEYIKKRKEQGHVQQQRAHARCWQHFLCALFSGYDGAKHDKSMTAECEAEVAVVPDVNTNLEKWDKRRGKQGEARAPWGMRGGGTGLFKSGSARPGTAK